MSNAMEEAEEEAALSVTVQTARWRRGDLPKMDATRGVADLVAEEPILLRPRERLNISTRYIVTPPSKCVVKLVPARTLTIRGVRVEAQDVQEERLLTYNLISLNDRTSVQIQPTELIAHLELWRQVVCLGLLVE